MKDKSIKSNKDRNIFHIGPDSLNKDVFSRLDTYETGVDCIIWITAKQGCINEPFIFIQTDEHNPDSYFRPNVAISISHNPQVIASNHTVVDKQIMQQIFRWIELNYDILLLNWRCGLSTSRLIQMLKPILKAKEDDDYFYIDHLKISPWHLSNFKSKYTGVDTMIWVSCRQPHINEPIILIRITSDYSSEYQWPNVAISISENPIIVASDGSTIAENLWYKLLEWISFNREALLDYWSDVIDIVELIHRLKKS